MRYLIPALLFSASVFSQGKDFTLAATIKGAADNSYVYLGHKLNDIMHSDSAKVVGEKANFKGKTPEPNMYWITRSKNDNPALIFFIDGGKVEISGHIDSLGKASVKAGQTQEDYKASIVIASNFFTKRQGYITRHNGYMQTGNAEAAKFILDSAQAEELKHWWLHYFLCAI